MAWCGVTEREAERKRQEKLKLEAEERGRDTAKGNKYLECKKDPVTGGILYVPINRGV